MDHLKNKKKLLGISLSVFMICALVIGTYSINRAQGVNYLFAQTDWSAGQTANVATHASNQAGWGQYGAKDASLTANSDVSIAATNAAVSKTTNVDFGPGTFSGVTISGVGEGASLQLQNQNMIDGGTGAEGAYSCPSGTCDLGGGIHNYTTFTIASGATVNVTGTSPLVIKATDSVSISGTLNLRGNNGGSGSTCWGGSGGVAKAGGYAGGDGAQCNNAGNSGFGPLGGVGGAKRTNNSGGPGGGGGGANTSLVSGGSGGGGGGGGYYTGSSGGGGGAGAGGGGVEISTLNNITITGTIDASGGNGGSGGPRGGGYAGGVGGGGGGGRISLNSASITNNGTINASGASSGGIGGIIILNYNDFSGTIPAAPSGGILTNTNTTGFLLSGTFMSPIADIGAIGFFSTLNYTTVLNDQIITVDARAGNTTNPDDDTWTDWQTGIANEGDISALSGNRYVQYRVNFSTTNSAVTPKLNDIAIHYNYYNSSSQTLTSNIYNTESSINKISKLQWTESLPANTDIEFQLCTSPIPSACTSWCGPDDGVPGICNGATRFTDKTGLLESIDDTQRDQLNDQYIQYRVFFSSADGQNTPILSDVSLSYATLSFPEVSTQAASHITSVSGQANANLANSGNENPERIIEFGTTSGAYTEECIAGTGGVGQYSCQLASLNPNTTYYYRAKATNSVGTSYGTEISFTTLPSQVTISEPDTAKMNNAVSSNYVSLDSGSITSTPSVTANTNVTIQDGVVSLSIPQSTQITNTESGNFNFQSFIAQAANVKASIPNSLSAVKIGVPNTKLTFSQPITLAIDVDSGYNGRTLDVLYQNDGETDWHSQTSCTITSGKCTFMTNHATTYSVNGSGNMAGETGINLNTDIQEVIALDCGSTIINLGNLVPGTPITGSSTCTATTNANGGYNLAVKRDDATSTLKKNTENSITISDLTPWDPITSNSNTWSGTGLGFTVYNSTANKNSAWWGTGTTLTDSNNKYAGFATTQTDIMRNATYAATSTATDIGYMLNVPPTQKSGAYSGSVTYQVVTTP